jgi:lipoprotein-anchoring transpeptidase ErfK/SrfK
MASLCQSPGLDVAAKPLIPQSSAADRRRSEGRNQAKEAALGRNMLKRLINARSAGSLGAVCVALLLAACSSNTDGSVTVSPASPAMYAAVVDNGEPIPSATQLPPQYQRQIVTTPSYIPNEPGTIVVDPNRRYLYLVMKDGKSRRYGIGVGRQGFSWSGDAVIKAKRVWPDWYPPAEMVARDPAARPWADGMPGGIENPLGARALYLYQGNKDTLYRLHGTAHPSSIGRAVSSGCIRLVNQDIIDLYNRVPIGTKVVVLGRPQLNFPPIAEILAPLFPPQPDAG